MWHQNTWSGPPPSVNSVPPPYGYGAPSSNGCTGPLPSEYTGPSPSRNTGPPASGYGYTCPSPSGYTGPSPSGYTDPPPSGYTGPPPSGYTGPPPSEYTVPPPSGYTVPPPSGYTAPPPSEYTAPPSGYRVPPPSGYTEPPPSGYTNSSSGYADLLSEYAGFPSRSTDSHLNDYSGHPPSHNSGTTTASSHNSGSSFERTYNQYSTTGNSLGHSPPFHSSRTYEIDNEEAIENFLSHCKGISNSPSRSRLRSRSGSRLKSRSLSRSPSRLRSRSRSRSRSGSRLRSICRSESRLRSPSYSRLRPFFKTRKRHRSKTRSRDASPVGSRLSRGSARPSSRGGSFHDSIEKSKSPGSCRPLVTQEEALECLRQLHEVEFKEYRINPNRYPEYESEKNLWDKHMKTKGFDLNHRAVIAEWNVYFKEILEKKFHEIWKEKKDRFFLNHRNPVGELECEENKNKNIYMSSPSLSESESFSSLDIDKKDSKQSRKERYLDSHSKRSKVDSSKSNSTSERKREYSRNHKGGRSKTNHQSDRSRTHKQTKTVDESYLSRKNTRHKTPEKSSKKSPSSSYRNKTSRKMSPSRNKSTRRSTEKDDKTLHRKDKKTSDHKGNSYRNESSRDKTSSSKSSAKENATSDNGKPKSIKDRLFIPWTTKDESKNKSMPPSLVVKLKNDSRNREVVVSSVSQTLKKDNDPKDKLMNKDNSEKCTSVKSDRPTEKNYQNQSKTGGIFLNKESSQINLIKPDIDSADNSSFMVIDKWSPVDKEARDLQDLNLQYDLLNARTILKAECNSNSESLLNEVKTQSHVLLKNSPTNANLLEHQVELSIEKISSDPSLDEELALHSPHLNLISILSEMGNKFGNFDTSLKVLCNMLQKAHNEGQCILNLIDEDAKTLLMIVKNKLKDFVAKGDTSVIQQAIYLETITNINSFLNAVKEKEEIMKAQDWLDSAEIYKIAEATKNKNCKDTITFIKEICHYRNFQMSNKNIMSVYLDVRKRQTSSSFERNSEDFSKKDNFPEQKLSFIKEEPSSSKELTELEKLSFDVNKIQTSSSFEGKSEDLGIKDNFLKQKLPFIKEEPFPDRELTEPKELKEKSFTNVIPKLKIKKEPNLENEKSHSGSNQSNLIAPEGNNSQKGKILNSQPNKFKSVKVESSDSTKTNFSMKLKQNNPKTTPINILREEEKASTITGKNPHLNKESKNDEKSTNETLSDELITNKNLLQKLMGLSFDGKVLLFKKFDCLTKRKQNILLSYLELIKISNPDLFAVLQLYKNRDKNFKPHASSEVKK